MKFNSIVRGLNSHSKIVVVQSAKEKSVSAATIGCWCVNSYCFGWIPPFAFKILLFKGLFAEMFKDIKQKIFMLKNYMLKTISSPRISNYNACIILTVEWFGLKYQLALLFRKVL